MRTNVATNVSVLTVIFEPDSVTLRSVDDTAEQVARLRETGGDHTSVEVKSAAGGLPESLTSSLSALANLPGGGTIILGLDERTGFTPVALRDVQALKQGLANKARAYTPPVTITIRDGTVDGSTVVVARVAECPAAFKPCRVTSTGKAYGRSYDGDFELSELEREAFIIGRGSPQFDRQPVPDSSIDDLDDALLAAWLRTVRERDPSGLGRYLDDAELLRRGGLTTRRGELSVAGLFALGTHPQQWFPRHVIQLASRTADLSARAADVATLTGPIPVMLAGAMDWARRVFAVGVAADANGVVRDRHEYPLEAFRELIGNAMVHRDLADWSRGFAIEVRHLPDRLVITNPGGLFGITVDRLGGEAVSSARNGRLLTICQYVRAPDDGARVVEALATGIPTVTAALAAARLPPALYLDTAIRFTVILRRQPPRTRPLVRGRTARAVWEALGEEPQNIAQLSARTGLEPANLRRVLRALRGDHLVIVEGGVGRETGYRRVPE